MHTKFWLGNLKGRDHLEDNIRMDVRELGWKDVDWIQLAQDSDQWRDLVNKEMNLRVP
jgi:hypothetical protein